LSTIFSGKNCYTPAARYAAIFTAVTRVQIPSGTPNLFNDLLALHQFLTGTKRHTFGYNPRAIFLSVRYFRGDPAGFCGHKKAQA
jgi:hypothetical protein